MGVVRPVLPGSTAGWRAKALYRLAASVCPGHVRWLLATADRFLGVGGAAGRRRIAQRACRCWVFRVLALFCGLGLEQPSPAMAWSGERSDPGKFLRRIAHFARSEERRVGKGCVGTCRSRGAPFR